MSFKRSEMLYDNGFYYKWAAKADHDNPYYRHGSDGTELNRTEGYEVLYFINHIGTRWISPPTTADYQKMERLIRYDVPRNLRSHKKIEEWITENF